MCALWDEGEGPLLMIPFRLMDNGDSLYLASVLRKELELWLEALPFKVYKTVFCTNPS